MNNEKTTELSRWRFTRWSRDSWEEMLSALEEAKSTIDFEQYYFVDLGDGLIGHRFVEVIERKAREGVNVRLLIDATGSWEFYRSSVVGELRSAGVEIEFHKTMFRERAGRFLQSFFRDHRRLIVIDGRIALVGGTAIKELAEDWRDTHVRLEGPVVAALQRAFDVLWGSVVATDRYKITKPETTPDKFTVLPNGIRFGQRFIYRSFLEAIRSAEKCIYITTPYFSPSHDMFRALRLAAKRGVDVRILLPEKCDFAFAQFVAESFYEGALRSGIKIYLYTPSFLHAKTVVIDDDWASVGSCNFDQLGFFLNYELNVLCYDPKFVLEMKNHFFDDLQSSASVVWEEWDKRIFLRRILEWLSYVARPLV